MAQDSAGRRALIADTVIAVLASAGARGLTHRAVDAAAGLPAGSASYYYRTREALLSAATVRLADLDLAEAQAAACARPGSRDELAGALAALVQAQCGQFRDRTVARYQLSLEAERYPPVRDTLVAMGERLTEAAIAVLAGLGARDPRRDARALIAVIEGLVYESTVGAQRPYSPAEVTALLSDLLAARLD